MGSGEATAKDERRASNAEKSESLRDHDRHAGQAGLNLLRRLLRSVHHKQNKSEDDHEVLQVSDVGTVRHRLRRQSSCIRW